MASPSTLLVVFVAATGLVPVLAAATECAPEPLAVTIGNVTLANNNIARGIEISIGTPAQSFAFLPHMPLNNSFVYGTDGHCATGYTTAECTTFRGGAYNTIGSSTRKVPSAGSYSVDASPWSSVSFTEDTFTLGVENSSSTSSADANSTTAIDNFVFGVPLNDLGQQGYEPMNAIGLGFNSSILNALKSTGKIASRTWSMFWGLNGADSTAQMEGVFVLGGYDAAKVVASQKYTLPLASSSSVCPSRMVLTITDMVLNFSNGTDASIFPNTESAVLQACITPSYPVLMTLPTDPYFSAIETLTNASIDASRSDGIVFFANRYLPKEANIFTGDLTIKLQSGLNVRVPNDQLIVPDRFIDTSGVVQANASGLDTTILAIQDVNAGDMMQLGRQFLSAAYVMLNQDANEFTLWQANPTTNRQLVAVDESNADVTSFCSGATSSSTASTTVSTAPPSSSTGATSSKKLPVGVIAGAAVGSLAGVAVISLAVVYMIRRARRKDRAIAATVLSADRTSFGPDQYSSRAVELMCSEPASSRAGSSIDYRKSDKYYKHQQEEIYEMGCSSPRNP